MGSYLTFRGRVAIPVGLVHRSAPGAQKRCCPIVGARERPLSKWWHNNFRPRAQVPAAEVCQLGQVTSPFAWKPSFLMDTMRRTVTALWAGREYSTGGSPGTLAHGRDLEGCSQQRQAFCSSPGFAPASWPAVAPARSPVSA